LAIRRLDKRIFAEWIIFNARQQIFETAYGIQLEKLRDLITLDPDAPDEAKTLARAHIINAFSMCDAQGTPARLIDFHSFYGCFTPEFYPRRFALKDSIYSQRLDILAALIAHVIKRYQTCSPPVKYCELSVGVGDLSSQWVFDVLRSVSTYSKTAIEDSKKDPAKHTYKATEHLSSFSQIVLTNHFPHLAITFKGLERTSSENQTSNSENQTSNSENQTNNSENQTNNNKSQNINESHVIYKFLAGFNRRKMESPFSTTEHEALHLLYDSPQEAILLMIREIIKSQNESKNAEQNTELGDTTNKSSQEPFATFLKELKGLKDAGKTMSPFFYDWVVGSDLFGDELGYPYCPFVARPFIKYINERQTGKDGKKNERFGIRFHCGENVIVADDKSPAYRLFITHMYIVFRSLRFLQRELKHGIRIGHGIAFNRILGASTEDTSRHRKSSVLLAEMREHAHYLFKTIPFEVNITSNEYLLGQTLRQGNFSQILRLDALFKLDLHIILATDDDGVWPIDRCRFVHPDHRGHHSLPAEYCRAISSSLFSVDDSKEKTEGKDDAAKRLKDVLECTPQFCFWNKTGDKGNMPEQLEENLLPSDDDRINSIIVYPNIIELIQADYSSSRTVISQNAAFENYKTYSGDNKIHQNDINWEYGSKRVAFICICANDDTDGNKETIRKQHGELFGKDQEQFEFIYENRKKIRSVLGVGHFT
jgi:hypothetical protein